MMIKKFLATGGLSAVLVGRIAGTAVAATYHPASAATTAAALQHLRATGPYRAEEQEPSGEATSPETDRPAATRTSASRISTTSSTA
jgi:hypothetical protein